MKSSHYEYPVIVAEFTTNTMGHFNLLYLMTLAAAKAGVDYIKMQKKDVLSFYAEQELLKPYKSMFGTTYFEYRNSLEHSLEDYDEFNDLVESLNDSTVDPHIIDWFYTPQDIKSLELLEIKDDFKYVKVASINSTNNLLLHAINEEFRPEVTVVISVAGKTLAQIERALEYFPDRKIIIQHCVAQYPTPVENLLLGNIPKLIEKFADERISIGYSGHEIGIRPSLAAIRLGAKMVERHFCVSKDSPAHHLDCALLPDEMAELVDLSKTADIGMPIHHLPETAYASSFDEKDIKFLQRGEYQK